MTHYLMGPFGNEIGGLYQLRMEPPPNVKLLIVYSEFPERSSLCYLEDSERIMMMNDWSQVVSRLKQRHGDNARVVVYPNADIQYCAG